MDDTTYNWATMRLVSDHTDLWLVSHHTDLCPGDDMLLSDRIITAEADQKALHMAANAHSFILKGERSCGAFEKFMAMFQAVLMIAEDPNAEPLDDSLSASGGKEENTLKVDPFCGVRSPWDGEAEDDGTLLASLEGLSAHIDKGHSEGKINVSITSEITPALIVILAILLHKMDHHRSKGKVKDLIQLLDSESSDILRTSFRIRFCTMRYLVKVTSVFFYSFDTVVKRAVAVAKGIQLISSGCPSRFSSVLAKLEVLCTMIDKSKTDASLRCFLVHMRTDAHMIDSPSVWSAIHTSSGSVECRTMISDLGGEKNFTDCKTIADKFDLSVICGCIMYLGRALFLQITIEEGKYSVLKASKIKQHLTELSSALSGKSKDHYLTILKSLLLVAWKKKVEAGVYDIGHTNPDKSTASLAVS